LQGRESKPSLQTTLEAELSEERERLRYLATHDPLTKLLNRIAFMEKVQEAVKAGLTGTQSALVYLDLDNFKLVNDSRGHATGDKVLSNVATVLRNTLRLRRMADQESETRTSAVSALPAFKENYNDYSKYRYINN
jgi:GGDEF domain-containing protein